MIAKNLIVLLSMALIAFVGVWSWFTNKTSATANGIEVECQAPDGIQIAIVPKGGEAPAGDDYTDGSITLTEESYPALFETLYMTEVTSDGISFIKPPLKQENGKAVPDLDADWDDITATANTDYLSFDLYVRSKTQNSVSLSDTSYIKPVSTNLLDTSSGNNLSTSGSFSRDSVIGAVRFSMVNTNSNNESRELLWIPAPNVHLNQVNGVYTVETNVTAESDDLHTYTHYYYNSSGEKCQVNSSKSSVKDEYVQDKYSGLVANYDYQNPYTLGKDVQVISLTKKSGDYYVDHVTCNLWIEGEDDEARLALVNGRFTVSLDLKIKNN
jgi:hypothetical protein